ncbi:ribbon-helix-helix protein, CopG family [Mycobacterium helveticum]|uniref:Ribbon-helix-helix protein, CopG family n=1 Tax=Mycobacterium helveticum TaxID=2592811 RepID=A0A557XVH9_9MYCO|nr:ribbon-helix-helix protein, CopG family [Mycobacterium helveticum]TVS86049.1 ribbon-helix-helix protein, CopG family [Mycobacterium helveticum]TVS90012.1 ribbon-helix-helix protein, CopG family [Mycobacterium helveticum]
MATSKKDAAHAATTFRTDKRDKSPAASHLARDERSLPESVDEETIARLVAEAQEGIPAEKLRRRGRPAISDEAARTYSVRLPDDLVALADERSEIDGVTRGETVRRALIEYLTK